MRASQQRVYRALLVFLLFILCASAQTEPDPVLLRLTPTQQRVHTALRSHDAYAALNAAGIALQLARSSGDTRYADEAEQLLLSAPPDARTRLLHAEVAQFRHEFSSALHWLNELLAQTPRESSAHLMAANIAFTIGDTTLAQKHCAALVGETGLALPAACLAYARSLRGQLSAAIATLQQLQPLLIQESVDRAAWIQSLQADMAERSGDDKSAQTLLHELLLRMPENLAARVTLCDLLLRQQRHAEAMRLLESHHESDPLLLRWLHLQRLTGTPQVEQEQRLLQRFARSRARGDHGHEREQALASWWLQHDPASALRYASSNFAQQKEPLDILLLAQLSELTGDRRSQQSLRHWLRDQHYQDVRIKTAFFGERT